MREKKHGVPPANNTTPVKATTSEDGAEKNIDAQLILPDDEEKEKGNKDAKKTSKLTFKISATPTRVRLDLSRVGHRISGRLTELGGASDVHTYNLEGEFRNLIAAGCYDNDNTSSLDRGSYSMMLIENGKKLEGYFSAYADEDHRIRPMKCILVKKNAAACEYETED